MAEETILEESTYRPAWRQDDLYAFRHLHKNDQNHHFRIVKDYFVITKGLRDK